MFPAKYTFEFIVCDTKELFVTATMPVRSRPSIVTGALPGANVMAEGANVPPTVSVALEEHEIVALPLVGTTPSDQFAGSLKFPFAGPVYQPGRRLPTVLTTMLDFSKLLEGNGAEICLEVLTVGHTRDG